MTLPRATYRLQLREGMTFAKAGVSVRSAHIATYAGQTLDTFYVTDFSGRPLDPSKVAQVVAVIIDTCDG